MDAFVEFFDEVSNAETSYLPPQTLAIKPHSLYRYDNYQWSSGFKLDCAVIKLTKGYFTLVEYEDFDKAMMLGSLRAREELCPQTGEVLKVRAVGEIGRKKYYLHRFLTDAEKGDIVDHFNHQPLDNRRRRNLNITNQGRNLAFARRVGKNGLLRGVEKWREKFGGKIAHKKTVIRSEEKWDTQEPAHAWYIAKHKELYGETKDTGLLIKRNYPILPPRVGEKVEEYIPF